MSNRNEGNYQNNHVFSNFGKNILITPKRNKNIEEIKKENEKLKRQLMEANRIEEEIKAKIKQLKKKIEQKKNNINPYSNNDNYNHMQVENDLFSLFDSPLIEQDNFHSPGLYNRRFSNYKNHKRYHHVIGYEDFGDYFPQEPNEDLEEQIIQQLYPNPDNMTYEQLLNLEEQVGSVSKGLKKTDIKVSILFLFKRKFPL